MTLFHQLRPLQQLAPAAFYYAVYSYAQIAAPPFDGPFTSFVQKILGLNRITRSSILLVGIHVNEQGNVQLAGFVENNQIPGLLSECHAVVLLSDHEGFGLSLLEGMASGVVPIALRGASGVTEFVVDDVTGLLVRDRGDDFVAAVRRLKDNPRLWDRLARSARSKAEAEYSEKVCADRWQELFLKLVKSSDPRRPFRIPRHLHLPPVHSALASLDPRPWSELIRRARRFASRLKHQYLPF